MINKILGIQYGRGCLKIASDAAPTYAPKKIQEMFPSDSWTLVTPAPFDAQECAQDRFGENFKIQQKIYDATQPDRHILVGGDHSVNYGHFVKLANCMSDTDLCLVYIDAHMDLHTPQSSVAQASGAPHGTNVRALLGQGDSRWLTLQNNRPALRPENLFYLATRSAEPAEVEYATKNNVYIRHASELTTDSDIDNTVAEIRARIGNRPFVLSFDFDAIDPNIFGDVLVPESGGISLAVAEKLLRAFNDAFSFEFVEYAPSGDLNCAGIVQRLIDIARNQ